MEKTIEKRGKPRLPHKEVLGRMKVIEKGLKKAVTEHVSFYTFVAHTFSKSTAVTMRYNHTNWFKEQEQRFNGLRAAGPRPGDPMGELSEILLKAERESPKLTHLTTTKMWLELTGKGERTIAQLFRNAGTAKRSWKNKITGDFHKLKMERALAQAKEMVESRPEKALEHESAQKLLKTLFNDISGPFKRQSRSPKFKDAVLAFERLFEEAKRNV